MVNMMARNNKMHKWKAGGLMAVVLAVIMTLSGCMRLQVTADVSEAGDITGDIHLLVHPTVLQMANLNIDDVIAQLERDYRTQYPDAVVEKISENVDGTAMQGAAIHSIHDDALHAEVTDTGMIVQFPIRTILDEVQKTANVSISTLKQYGSQAVLTIRMPSPPETNVGTVSGNTVTIDLLSVPEGINDAVITCGRAAPEPVKQISWIRRCVIAVHTMAMVVMVLRLAAKKKK